MITMRFIGGTEVVEKLVRMEPEIEKSLLATITRLSIKLQAKVMEDKLSGQVLKTKTGTLRRSITYKINQTQESISGTVGTNVSYGLTHEFGFHGTVNVKAHLRTIKQVYGRPLPAPKQILIGEHSRMMNLPAKSFLRSALREMKPEIKQAIQEAIKR